MHVAESWIRYPTHCQKYKFRRLLRLLVRPLAFYCLLLGFDCRTLIASY